MQKRIKFLVYKKRWLAEKHFRKDKIGMSTVFETIVSGDVVAKNGKFNGNGAGTAARREVIPIGLNGQKVVS